MLELFAGKKTYITAAAIIATAIAAFANGDATVVEAVVIILNGLGLGTLRAGVKKAEK